MTKGAEFQRVQTPPGNWVAPAGSNRSGSRGNEAVEAFDVKAAYRRPASRQAVTRVNAEQAPKRKEAGADPPFDWGRPPSGRV